jgi:two-component system chemotaxis response regulator CheY
MSPLCLIVDDSRVIRRMAADILKSLGLRTAEAENGLQGVEFCRATVPDMVLLDWNMPEMDGITCLRALRAMKLEPRPLVVMCTTESGMPKICEALEAGADEYIMKPYDQGVLLDKLSQLGLVERA